jgi:hypothetical protein
VVEHQIDQKNFVRPFGAMRFFGGYCKVLMHAVLPELAELLF